MRTARFLLLIVYVAGHTGLPLPLPAGACAPGACGCGAACQCAQEKVAAGTCCCAAHAARSPASERPCCAAKSESLCSADSEAIDAESVAKAKSQACCNGTKSDACCDDERPRLPVLRPCGCQQEAPEGIAACSDPRVPPARTAPPHVCCCGRLSPAGGPAASMLVQSPDDPVPRAMA